MKTLKGLAAFVVALAAVFTAPSAAAEAIVPNYTNAWWNESQSGMGVFCVHQGTTIFCSWFHYGPDGGATFLVFAGLLSKNVQGKDQFVGSLSRSAGPQPMTYDASKARLGMTAGTVTMVFASTSSATMTYNFDDGRGVMQAGTMSLSPFQFGCTPPAQWNGTFCVIPMGTKVVGANQLPPGCNTWKDQCWRDAVANGTVKLVESTAKEIGLNDRPMMFAFFRNSTTGKWGFTPFYGDDGSTFTEIGGQSTVEIDWVYGNEIGVVFHDATRNSCGQSLWDAPTKTWFSRPTSCP
jgi:hypothetical protein